MQVKKFILENFNDTGKPVVEGFDSVFPTARKIKSVDAVVEQGHVENQPEPDKVQPKQEVVQRPEIVHKPEARSFSEEELVKSRTAGYEEGYAKGYNAAKSAAEEVEKAISSSLKAIKDSIVNIEKSLDNIEQKDSKEIVGVAIEVARKIIGNAINYSPIADIEQLIRSNMGLILEHRKIAIVVNSTIYNEIKDKVANIITEVGFRGEIDIKSSDNIAKGSCNIEWSGGGMKSDKTAMMDEIDKIYESL